MSRLQPVEGRQRVLPLSRVQIYSLVRQEIIPAVKIGRRLYFDPDQINRFIESGGRAWPGGWRRRPEGGGES